MGCTPTKTRVVEEIPHSTCPGLRELEFPVFAHVYFVDKLSGLRVIGLQAFHTEVQIMDKVYAFGAIGSDDAESVGQSGVFSRNAPADCQVHDACPKACEIRGMTFVESIPMGTVRMSQATLDETVAKFVETFQVRRYHLLHNNCNHFADQLCLVLSGQGLPSWVNKAATVGSDLISIVDASFDNVVVPANKIRPIESHAVIGTMMIGTNF